MRREPQLDRSLDVDAQLSHTDQLAEIAPGELGVRVDRTDQLESGIAVRPRCDGLSDRTQSHLNDT